MEGREKSFKTIKQSESYYINEFEKRIRRIEDFIGKLQFKHQSETGKILQQFPQ